ncbi:MAG TPA: protein kinase [Chthoniobacterales bacterium]|jgi:serine/threonine protein kinase
MAPQVWQEVKEILGEALQREGDAREAFVAEACAHDPQLREQVETYLSVSGETLEACADNLRDTVRSAISPQRAGSRIGAYRIVREIGRGGMGTVFLAARADGEFEKDVAIKILKRGTDTDEIVRRFRSERQILARLEHPNIARLIDAGSTDSGLPYFVMEFVDGVAVTQFVREHRLSIRERLELFLKICSAVSRSHRDRIVHRDLKPTNILVTTDGEPKILDFGIAKLLDAGDNMIHVTATQQQRFTPTCVSPEQARGEPVTTASDIYALGALLYEMLTGETPHQFATTHPSLEELSRVVCEEEIRPPSQVVASSGTRQELKGDIDNIVLCALRKEPTKRYATVQEFGEDIRRHLNAAPIEAHAPTAIYRATQFFTSGAHRRYWSVVGAVAALIVIIALIVGSKMRSRGPASGSMESTAPVEQKSIAVLPFDSLDNRGDDSYLVNGVQDNILTDLAKVSQLRVISRSGVERYRGARVDPRLIGRDLNVAYVLEGSVQKSGDRIRINVRLVDTRTNTQTWSEGYERTVDDLLGLQSELAQSIVTQLKANLSPAEKAAIEQRPTNDMEAYDLYLQARGIMNDYNDVDLAAYHRMLELLDRATARDPNFAIAYCFATEVNALLYRYREHTPERLAKTQQAASMAQKLAPDLGESHLAQALYFYHCLRDYFGAERELELARPTLGGRSDYLLVKEMTERRFGHWQSAIKDGEKALSLDPRNPVMASVLMQTYIVLRMYSEAEAVADAIIAKLTPDKAGGMWSYKYSIGLATGELKKAREAINSLRGRAEWKDSMLATIQYYERDYAGAAETFSRLPLNDREPNDLIMEAFVQRQLGNAEKVLASLEKANEMLLKRIDENPDDPNLRGSLAMSYALAGNKAEALKEINRAAALAPPSQDSIDSANWLNVLAQVYVLNSDTEAALDELTKVVNLPNGPSFGELRLDPAWDLIRNEQRFKYILSQASTPPVYN